MPRSGFDNPPSTLPSSFADALDPAFRAALAQQTASLSPMAGVLSASDWAMHLAASPGKCLDLLRLALQKNDALLRYATEEAIDQFQRLADGPQGPQGPQEQAPPGATSDAQTAAAQPPRRHLSVKPPTLDPRFAAPEWQQWPFNVLQQSFSLTEEWWTAATRGVWGVDKHHEDIVAFAARQLLDVFSPGNQLLTNPVALQRTREQGGMNLVHGALNALDDWRRALAGEPPAGAENFAAGQNLAITPGKVVLKNHLIELLQYAPTTETVHPEPILITPAWIMKYYILDLSPHNSLVRYLVDHGFTVFCISWKNPTAEDRDLSLDDYLNLGFRAALAAVNAIVPERKVHAVGYCLGGTLLAIAAAAMARDGDERLATMTLFAAQTDFTEPGELALFIDESQLSLLEAQMDVTGYLRAEQMAGAFQMLRSYDLLWSRMVNDYLLGERRPLNDLMAWNADGTRMPATMHTQYLRRLFLDDDLSEGRYHVDDKPVSLGRITLPTFMVGTETDHVAPWRSVHKLHYLSPAEITFALTSGGHNAGIVSPPGHPRRHHRILTRPAEGNYVDPDDWLALAELRPDSWWPSWLAWLEAHSGAPVAPPAMGAKGYPPLADAPGTYVLQK